MCTLLFSWQEHPKYQLVLLANRDEFYRRPTAPASFWEETPHIFAGKDLVGGGTWMGVSKAGRFAALTNYRDLDLIDDDAPSRGKLVSDFLNGGSSPFDYLERLRTAEEKYNPYNLIVGDLTSLCYYSNMKNEVRCLAPGIYGLSNALLNDPWPKVKKGKSILQSYIKTDQIRLPGLMRFLEDKSEAADDELPNTGVPYRMEKGLSALFIEMPGYGTRCSTGILMSDRQVEMVEKTYAVGEQKESVVSETIPIHPDWSK